MPWASLITKLAFAAGALVQPALGLPSSSVRPSATLSRSTTPSHSVHVSSRTSSSLRPTSTAVLANGNSSLEINPDAACALIAAGQGIYYLANANKDTADSDVLAAFAEEDPIPAHLAYACLQSVPLNKTAATEWIKFIKPYVEFQATLGWLKNPPPSYQQPAVDIMGGLDTIASSVTSGKYKGEYDFEVAVSKLFQSSHDGHFGVYLPLLAVFPFVAPYQFVSISQDGVKLPEIYVYSDFGAKNTTAKAPSPVKTINGKPAADYMTQFAKDFVVGFIDPQTDWNQLFVNKVAGVGGGSTFEGILLYPGSANLTLTFANGTTVSQEWSVPLSVNFTDIKDGQDVYDKFVAPAKEEVKAPANETQGPSKKEWGAPYPRPVLVQKNLGAGGFLTGYFLNKSSTAVLSLTSFEFVIAEDILSFAQSVEEFLAKCKSTGMKKLVIDVQSNGGGLVAAGFELFQQLFPTLTPFAGGQFRVPKAVDLIGSTIGAANASVQAVIRNQSETADPYWFPAEFDANNNPFSSWAALAGQQTQNGDRISNTFRQNITRNNELAAALGVKFPRAPQVFAAKDVLILTNGACSSTCTIFAEEMHTQAGVKVVVAGGSPVPGQMQGVAGVRGSRLQAYTNIDNQVAAVLAFNPNLTADLFPSNKSIPLQVKDYATRFSVNLLNQVRQSKQDVPLHFTYQAADCRIFYTQQMLADYSYLWQYAADALWNNPGLCVQGSTGHPSAAPNVTTITAVSINNGTSSTPHITTNGAGSSNGGLNMVLVTGAIISFVALLL